MAVLKMKSTGKDVEKYQAALNKAGISRKLKVDGIFGRKTEASTKGFQKKKSLKPDGIAGKKTLAAAGIGRQPPPPKMTFDDAKEFKLVYESSANYMLGESQNIENLTKTEIAKLKVAEKTMLAMTSELRSHIKNFDKEVKKAMPLTEKIVVLQSEFKKIAKSDPVRAQGILDEIKILDPKSFAIYVKADNIKDKYYVTYEKYEKLVAKLN